MNEQPTTTPTQPTPATATPILPEGTRLRIHFGSRRVLATVERFSRGRYHLRLRAIRFFGFWPIHITASYTLNELTDLGFETLD